jgi:hypothetical protein
MDGSGVAKVPRILRDRRYRKRCLDRGICGKGCGRPLISGLTVCYVHNMKDQEYMTWYRKTHRNIGWCTWCSRPAKPKALKCAKCLAADAMGHKRWRKLHPESPHGSQTNNSNNFLKWMTLHQ